LHEKGTVHQGDLIKMSMKRKKLLLASGILVFLGAVGFQLVDQNLHMLQSPGAQISDYKEIDYGLGSSYIDSLKQYPELKNGEIAPFNIWEYAGKGKSSFDIPELPMSWEEWIDFHKKQKPELMEDVNQYMSDRFDFNGEVMAKQFMSGERKPTNGRTYCSIVERYQVF
jgi:cytochrome c peroxidase